MLSEFLKSYSNEEIIERLMPFLTKERMERIDMVVANRMHSVQVAIERPYDIHNGLAVVRTAEALGIPHIHFIDAQMKKGEGKGTTKGTMKWVHLHRHATLKSFLQAKKICFLWAHRLMEQAPLKNFH